MKTNYKLILLSAVTIMGLISIGQAGPNLVLPKGYDHVIKSQGEAKKLPAKANIALSCKDCKTVIAKCCVDDKPKGFLSWFKAEETHGCSGCGGTVKYVGSVKNPTAVHAHECSKCGKGSASTCSDHVPGK